MFISFIENLEIENIIRSMNSVCPVIKAEELADSIQLWMRKRIYLIHLRQQRFVVLDRSCLDGVSVSDYDSKYRIFVFS